MNLYLSLNNNLSKEKLKEYSNTLLFDTLKLNQEMITKNNKGKPYLKTNDFYFNLSHSINAFGFVKCENEVGFDLENIRDVKNIELLKKKIINDNDINEFKTIGSKELLIIWTIKEAYLKYLGIGLITEPKLININYKNKMVSYINYEQVSYYNDIIDNVVYAIVSKEIKDLKYEIL